MGEGHAPVVAVLGLQGKQIGGFLGTTTGTIMAIADPLGRRTPARLVPSWARGHALLLAVCQIQANPSIRRGTDSQNWPPEDFPADGL
jgi:hypothetical protein